MKHLPTTLKLPEKTLVRLKPLSDFSPMSKNLKNLGFAFPKNFKSAVVVDKKGSPKYFVFDTQSLWDMLCACDAKLEERATAEEYTHQNPVGWLIDEIEQHLPINPELTKRLKKNMEKGSALGLVPLKKIKQSLGLR